MSYANNAAAVTPPVQAKNLWVLAGSDYSTVDYVEVPDAWKGCLLTLEADGDKFYYVFAKANNASSSKTGASTVTSNAFTALGDNAMDVIPDGDDNFVNMDLIEDDRDLVLIILSDTGAGQLRIRRSGGPVKVD